MQEQINQLRDEVAALKSQLANTTMPFELREIMRNENVTGEDSTVTLVQNYPVVAAAVDAPVAYTGTILLKNKGKEYVIGYITKR